MAVDFKYVEHPRVAEREKDGPVTTRKIIKKVGQELKTALNSGGPVKGFVGQLGAQEKGILESYVV